jgi:hypothetical protein
MNREALIGHLASDYQLALEQAQQLVEFADERGLSDPDTTFEAVLATNRAGVDESRLSVVEILRQYRGTEPSGDSQVVFRRVRALVARSR